MQPRPVFNKATIATLAIIALIAASPNSRAEMTGRPSTPATAPAKPSPKPGKGLLWVTLLDVDGKPAKGVVVSVYDTTARESKELAKAATDNQGRVSFDLAPTAKVTCSALIQPPAPVSPAPGEKFAQSDAVAVRAGEVTEVKMTLQPANF
jgi:hypothetical protein